MLLWEREQSKPAKEREQLIYCLKDSYKQFSQLFWTDCMCCLKGHETTNYFFSDFSRGVYFANHRRHKHPLILIVGENWLILSLCYFHLPGLKPTLC